MVQKLFVFIEHFKIWSSVKDQINIHNYGEMSQLNLIYSYNKNVYLFLVFKNI